MTPARVAPVALLAATAAVSVSAILITEARTDAATVVWLRMALTVVLLSPWAIPRLARGVAVAGTGRDIAMTLVAGLCLAVHFISWTASLADTSVAASVLLVSLHPLIVAPVGARLFGDRLDGGGVSGIALALAGTAFTCLGTVGTTPNAVRGDLLAMLGGAALAGYLLIGRGRRARGGVTAYSAVAYAVVAAAAVVTAAVGGSLHVPGTRALLACAGLATICTIGGHTVFNWTLHHLPAGTVSLAFLGEPPLAALLAFLVLGQSISVTTMVGGVLILGGLGITLSRNHGGSTRLTEGSVTPARR